MGVPLLRRVVRTAIVIVGRKPVRFLMLAAPVALFSSPAAAEPVYLVCSLANAKGEGRVTLDVTVNEDTGRAGFAFRETGWSVQGLNATFTPTAVTWGTKNGAIVLQYSIDRTSLHMVERSVIIGTSSDRTGKCELAPKIDRQF